MPFETTIKIAIIARVVSLWFDSGRGICISWATVAEAAAV
jgi:hypothetical protein